MTATMITIANFAADGATSLQRYVETVLPLLERSGAKVRRYSSTETLVGSDRFDLVAIMDFPSETVMKEFLASPAYQAMDADRDRAFKFLTTFSTQALSYAPQYGSIKTILD